MVLYTSQYLLNVEIRFLILCLSVFQDFYSPHEYVVTQIPLPDTVVDFWRLVFDHECQTIITLSEVDPERQVS